jgi:hypothetical protein
MRAFSVLIALGLVACDPGNKASDTADLGEVDDADLDGDGYPASEDCDDDDAAVNPGATEVCDGVDNNCEDGVDEGVAGLWYTDADGDGFGDADDVTEGCDQPAGAVPSATDCDDTDAAVYPSAPETCNGLDDNCDGQADEGLAATWYPDEDGDGFGDADGGEPRCDEPEGWVQVGTDCDDAAGDIFPGAAEVCNGVDEDCDGDIDEGATTTYYFDVDGDGYGDDAVTTEDCASPSGYAELGGDCDDTSFETYPGAPEFCNGVDDNCDGRTDEDDARDALTWHLDGDGDGYGVSASTTTACEQPSGYAAPTTAFDCDDAESTTNPGADEYCDGHDDDCDGSIDEDDSVDAGTWYIDADSDGYGSTAYTLTQCSQPSGYVTDATDCDDLTATTSPGATETCNGVDDDCDGTADDGLPTSTWYADDDGDGYGDPAAATTDCAQPSGTVSDDSDCDDTESSISPDGTETCNGVDDDCDGFTDDDDSPVTGTYTWYADTDGDGYGDLAVTTDACQEPTGYTDDTTDCDDGGATVSPGGSESCNGVDDDCDGDIDENLIGMSSSCTAESCAEILSAWAGATDGDYQLDPDGTGATTYTCDMTTDGGGWTGIVYWDRINDGDDKADFNSHFTVLRNNMGTFSNETTSLYWQDRTATADVLSVEKDVPVPNDGELLYELQHTGTSMEQSAAFFWAESGGSDVNLECWNGVSTWGNYSTAERGERPGYTCGVGYAVSGGSRNFSWTGFVQDDLGAEITNLRFASFHYDGCCDYSYLYRAEAWVR